MRALVHTLFCDVVVVSTLDIALDLVGREPGWRFVTRAGNSWTPRASSAGTAR